MTWGEVWRSPGSPGNPLGESPKVPEGLRRVGGYSPLMSLGVMPIAEAMAAILAMPIMCS